MWEVSFWEALERISALRCCSLQRKERGTMTARILSYAIDSLCELLKDQQSLTKAQTDKLKLILSDLRIAVGLLTPIRPKHKGLSSIHLDEDLDDELPFWYIALPFYRFSATQCFQCKWREVMIWILNLSTIIILCAFWSITSSHAQGEGRMS